MAVLTNPTVLASDTSPGVHWAVLEFQKVTAGDTFDLATLTAIAAFVSITSAIYVPTSNRTATRALATIAGTVVTAVGAGMAADACLLFVEGE